MKNTVPENEYKLHSAAAISGSSEETFQPSVSEVKIITP